MSWLGGLNDSFNQISNLTGQLGGQISNFTKEVLTEGTEEDIDYEVEAKKLRLQLKQYEENILEHEALVKQLQHENAVLKDKNHTAELHVSTSGIEYEARLQQKNNEITQLKQKLSNHGNSSSSTVFDATSRGIGDSYHTFSSVSLNDEDDDFHDIIRYQREITRLAQELEEARSESERWKEKANAPRVVQGVSYQGNGEKTEDGNDSLLNRIRELETVLCRESDHHQQEVQSIQTVHNASITRYQEEIRKLKNNLSPAPTQDSQASSEDDKLRSHRQELGKLQTELDALKEQLRNRNRQLQAQKNQLEELNLRMQEVKDEAGKQEKDNLSLREELKKLQLKNTQFSTDSQIREKNMQEILNGFSQLLLETGIQVEEIEETNAVKAIDDVRELYLRLLAENSQVVGRRSRDEIEIRRLELRVAELQEAVESNAEERGSNQMALEGDSMYDMELAESDQWHQENLNQEAEEDQNQEEFVAESDQHRRRGGFPVQLDFGHPLTHSSPQVLNSSNRRRILEANQHPHPEAPPGDLTLTLQALQKQVEDYELEIEQYEQVQSEWQQEKQSLQEILNRYQNEVGLQEPQTMHSSDEPEDERAATVARLRKEMEELSEAKESLERERFRLLQEKEQLQVATKNLQEELDSSISEAQAERDQLESLKNDLKKNLNEKLKLESDFENLTDDLNKSRMEKDELDEALDALDSQHQDEMVQLLSVRDELRDQLKTAQNQIKLEKEEKEKMHQSLENLRIQNAELSKISEDSINETSSSFEHLLSESNAQKLEFEKKFKDFEEELKKLKYENNNILTQNEELKEKFYSISNEKKELDDKVTQLENLASKNEKENKEILSEVERVRAECSSLSGEVEERKKILEESEKKHLEDVEKIRSEMQAKLNDKDERIQNLQTPLDEALRTIKKEEECLQQKDESASVKDSQISDLEQKVEEMNRLIQQKDEFIKSNEKSKSSLEKVENEERLLVSQVSRLEENVRILRKSLDAKEEEVGSILKEKKGLEEKLMSEIQRIQEENESLGLELENAGKEVAKTQSSHDNEIKKIQLENQDALRMAEEDSRSKLLDLEENHKCFLLEANTTNKVYVEKISHLEKINENLQKQLEDLERSGQMKLESSSEDLSKNWESKLTRIQEDNSKVVNNLEEQNLHLSEQFKILQAERDSLKMTSVNERTSLEIKLKQEFQLREESQKNQHLLQDDLQKAGELENTLRAQLGTLNVELSQARHQIDDLSQRLSNVEANTLDKNNKVSTQTDTFKLEIQKIKTEYDARVKTLLQETEELKRRLATQAPNSSTPALDIDKALEEIRRRDLGGLEKSDLSKDDIGSLLHLIRERDEVITILTQQRAASSRDSTSSVATIKQLEDENRTLSAEKDQILAVISGKTRENKKLKDEAHKMMNILAEGKAALAKVQQENASLLAKYEGYDREMTKEAVGKLSRLVQEKELEIESLKQKCGTLLEVLQQQQPGGGGSAPVDIGVTGQQVQSLLRDKEILTQQVQQLLTERNHLVALLNQRQTEVDESRAEVAKAAEALERDADNNSKLQISFGNLVHEYEQTQMRLRSVQKELATFKEKLNHLEETKEVLLTKVELLEDSPSTTSRITTESIQKSSVAVNGDLQSADEHQPTVDKNSLEKSIEAKAEINRMLNDMKEKDIFIHSKTEENTRVKRDLAAKSNEVEILRKSVENLREQVTGLSRNCDESRTELRNISSRLAEKESESQAFQETNAQLSMLLKEKEYEVENAKDKCKRLEAMVQENQQGKESESQRILHELDEEKQRTITARHERDQIMLALKQRKLETDKYSEESRMLREKESKLESELSRLRNHLIQVEEAYTQEAMLAEDREKCLSEELQKICSTNSAVREATEHSQLQAESLQEQLRTAIAQRDQAIQQLQLTQEQGMQYATALQKLQVAVERMQREEAATFAEQMEKVKQTLEKRNNDANVSEAQVKELMTKLEEANQALESASRLNQQLELKEENIEQLKSLVAEKQLHIDDLQDRIHHITNKNVGMVDKEILKNLLIGYFTSPGNKKNDVLHLLEAVLDFSAEEISKVESGGTQGGRSWIGGWLWKGGGPHTGPSASVPNSPRSSSNPNESFTQMFVKFLENESVPHQAARLPTATMISEAQQRRAPRSPGLSSVPTPIGTTAAERAAPMVAGRYRPFLLTSTGTTTPSKGHGPHTSSAGQQMLHLVTPILPTFSPITNPKPSSERDILQDILRSGSER